MYYFTSSLGVFKILKYKPCALKYWDGKVVTFHEYHFNASGPHTSFVYMNERNFDPHCMNKRPVFNKCLRYLDKNPCKANKPIVKEAIEWVLSEWEKEDAQRR